MKIIAATVRRHHAEQFAATIRYCTLSLASDTIYSSQMDSQRIPIPASTMTHLRDVPLALHVNATLESFTYGARTGTQLAPTHLDATQTTDGFNRVYLNKIALRSEQFTFNVETVHTEPILLFIGRFYTIYVFYPYKISKATQTKIT